MTKTGQDSAGRSIEVGDKVRFRGQVYTIKSFTPGAGQFGASKIEFNEPQHTDEEADEIKVDKVSD